MVNQWCENVEIRKKKQEKFSTVRWLEIRLIIDLRIIKLVD